MWPLSKSKTKASSRKQIRIKEVKDGILVLPDEEYRLIIETSSVNFELKSDEEQDVLIDGFQNFLNSLPCRLQILIRVRELDIDHYLERISDTRDQEKEKVYRNQIETYGEFIKKLVAGNRILSRRFYIVIPYKNNEKTGDFNLLKEQIYLNRDIVLRGLEKLGMRARQLNSLEILELFYGFYNGNQAKTQELKGETIRLLLQNNYV
jgi:hypothetical protein